MANMTAMASRILEFHAACSGHVDAIPVTARFRFRTLLSELETESKDLRVNAIMMKKRSNGGTDSLCQDVGRIRVTLKELIGIMSR